MLQRHESHSFLPIPFGIALCGLAFCGWNLWSADTLPCVSAGCTLFRNFSVAGVSLWWLGVFGFAVLAACSLAGRLTLGKAFAALGLALDCLLLVLMLGTAPCLPCLGAALLLALTYLFFLLAAHSRQRTFTGTNFSILLVLWGCLFIANFGGLIRDSLQPWAMLSPAASQETAIKAYVSPSCPACRQLVRELPTAQADKIAWFPVAENEQDLRVIGAMLIRLREGDSLSKALPAALEAPLAGKWALLQPDMLLLQLRLWRNQAHVMENGGIMPHLEFSGVPAFMLPQARPAAPHVSSQTGSSPRPAPRATGQDPNLPSELDIINRCTQSGEPCP